METYPFHKIETLYERDMATFKVDPSKLKNRTYSLIKTWQWTEKIDGTNIRIIWQDGKLSFGGKTDNAQIHGDLIKHLYELISPVKLAEVFPDTTAVIYGEGYGAGIQKGGGYSASKKFIAFDVLVGGKWWLNWENTCDVAEKLEIDVVPFVGEMSLEAATEMVRVGFKSPLAMAPMAAEGLVGRTAEPLFDKKGARLIVKLKTKDFA
jgi:hypothetical protein